MHDAISKDFKGLKKYADLGSYDDLQKRYFSTKNVVSVIVEILEKLRTKMTSINTNTMYTLLITLQKMALYRFLIMNKYKMKFAHKCIHHDR